MNTTLLLPLIFLAALLYSSVGHGGASAYLAILALAGVSREISIPSALCLNILVSGVAFLSFRNSGHFRWRLTLPFLLASVPGAFIGGLLKVSSSTYSFLLGIALLFAALRIGLITTEETKPKPSFFNLTALPIGAGIGLVSGMIGIGGGIFLSPLLLIFKWATAKETAATSAFFILMNSVAALLARSTHSSFAGVSLVPLILPAFFGGLIGSRLGAGYLNHITLRRLLSFILGIVSIKLIYAVL